MVRVEWAAPALADLQEVHDFIARDSPRYAQITIERIQQAAGSLGSFPRLGHVLPEFPDDPYRQILAGAYRIIYRQDTVQDRILIMAVVHAARDLPPIMESRLSDESTEP
jgi:toxin ParE1/3/4